MNQYKMMTPYSFRNALTIIFFFFNQPILQAQSIVVGFYNLENFYDTTHQLNVSDEEFLPTSNKGYNSALYKNKSAHLASVIYAIGKLNNANGLSLLGIAEVENKNVLLKLASEPILKKYNYQFIHFDSKDVRGIDVALMYHPGYFKPYQYRSYSLTDKTHFSSFATRDILYVHGLLQNTWVHVLVNHWPSRRGGETASKDKRFWAATVCKKIMDSIEKRDPTAKIIVMGDFNDNPNNKSIKALKLYNPFLQLFNKGMGSMAYKDTWSLFDQILLNQNWTRVVDEKKRNHKLNRSSWVQKASHQDSIETKQNKNDIMYCKPIIYRNSILTEQEGRFQGYPKRTWNGDQFIGGYSDHYPAVLIFKSKNDEKPFK